MNHFSKAKVSQELESIARDYVYDRMDPRCKSFVRDQMQSFGPVLNRQFKYSLPDMPIGILNTVMLPARAFSKKAHIRTMSERVIQKRYREDVICPQELEKTIQRWIDERFFVPFINDVAGRVEELRKYGEYDPEVFEAKARKAMEVAVSRGGMAGDLARSLVDLAVGLVLTGSLLSDGTVAVATGGASLANGIYLSQITGFAWLWAQIAGSPVWVGALGGVLGASTLLLVVLPLVGAVMEYGVNRKWDPYLKIRKAYPDMIKAMVGSTMYEPPADKKGLLGMVMPIVDGVVQARSLLDLAVVV